VAKASGKPSEFAENPLIAELIAAGAENSKLLRGFIGAPSDDRYITLHPSLARIGDSMQIPREDILHLIDAPGSGPGAVMLWVKEDSQTFIRTPQATREVVRGRLRMKLRSKSFADDCVPCDPCEPNCGPPCEVLPTCMAQ
jgi:hypothetical protein